MPSWSALSEVPIEEYRICAGVRCGAGGGSRTHFSHPLLDAYYGLLRDVSAARRLSRSAFGGLANPGLFAPGDLDRDCWNCISLLRTGAFFLEVLPVVWDPVPDFDEFQSSEYLVPYLACYLQCFFFRGDVPD